MRPLLCHRATLRVRRYSFASGGAIPSLPAAFPFDASVVSAGAVLSASTVGGAHAVGLDADDTVRTVLVVNGAVNVGATVSSVNCSVEHPAWDAGEVFRFVAVR